eukprot:13773208-Ditylum_brightwellii.AAC.1
MKKGTTRSSMNNTDNRERVTVEKRGGDDVWKQYGEVGASEPVGNRHIDQSQCSNHPSCYYVIAPIIPMESLSDDKEDYMKGNNSYENSSLSA